MRPEASTDYPSYLPPIVDVLLLVLVVVLLAVRSGSIYSVGEWLEARLGGTCSSLAKLFLAGCLVHLITLAFLGVPQAWVSDEQAYLLGAETFASGRLTNPAPLLNANLDQHFAQDHVLSAPTRQSKYPPGQSLLLALGTLAGHPVVTLTLAAGVMTVCLAWCLGAFLSHSMAAFGSLLSLFWVGAGSYWNHSYWGGSLAAIGGALVLGSALRLHQRSQSSSLRRAALHGLLLGLGVTVLAVSRPFEGLVYCLPIAAAILIGFLDRRTAPAAGLSKEFATVIIASVTAMVGLLCLAVYNQAVTGHALTLPHVLYTSQGALGEHHFQWTLAGNGSWPQRIPGIFAIRTSLTAWFLLGTPLTLCLLGLFVRRIAAPSSPPTTPLLVPPKACIAAVFGVLVAQSLAVPWFPHYPSPAYAGMLLISLVGLENLASVSLFGRTWKSPLLVAAALCAIVGCAVRLPAHRIEKGSEIALRQQILEQLPADGDQHLVLIDPGQQGNGFWVHNPPDPLDQTVLWARSLGADRDQQLVLHLNRKTWRLRFAQDAFQLVPYPFE